jgi:hypothetical protein
MLASCKPAPLPRQPIHATSLSRHLRPSSWILSAPCEVPAASHHLAPSSQNCPFRITTIRIAFRVNPFSSQPYKNPTVHPSSRQPTAPPSPAAFSFQPFAGSAPPPAHPRRIHETPAAAPRPRAKLLLNVCQREVTQKEFQALQAADHLSRATSGRNTLAPSARVGISYVVGNNRVRAVWIERKATLKPHALWTHPKPEARGLDLFGAALTEIDRIVVICGSIPVPEIRSRAHLRSQLVAQ